MSQLKLIKASFSHIASHILCSPAGLSQSIFYETNEGRAPRLVRVDSFAASRRMTSERSWSRRSCGGLAGGSSRRLRSATDFRSCGVCFAQDWVSLPSTLIAWRRHSTLFWCRGRSLRWYFEGSCALVWLALTWVSCCLPLHPCWGVCGRVRKVSCWWNHWSRRSHSPSTASSCCRCDTGW